MAEKLLYTADELIEVLGIGRSTVWKMLNRGEIRSFKVGHLRKITRAELERWVARKEEDAATVA